MSRSDPREGPQGPSKEDQLRRPEGFPEGRIEFGRVYPCTPCKTNGKRKDRSGKTQTCGWCNGVGYRTTKEDP